MKIVYQDNMSDEDKVRCLDFCLESILPENNVIYPREKGGILCRKLDKQNWKTENIFGFAYVPNGGRKVALFATGIGFTIDIHEYGLMRRFDQLRRLCDDRRRMDRDLRTKIENMQKKQRD